MVTNYDGDKIEFREELPLIPIRDYVLYPFMIVPVFVSRESSMKAIEAALQHPDKLIMVCSQKELNDNPKPHEIYDYGLVAMIVRWKKLPDGRLKVLLQGLARAKVSTYLAQDPFYQVKIENVQAQTIDTNHVEAEALMKNVKDHLEKIVHSGKYLSQDILTALEDMKEPSRFADIVSFNLNLKVAEAQALLEIYEPVKRLAKLNQILAHEIEIIQFQQKNKVTDTLSKNEQNLKEQLKALKGELNSDQGDKDNEFEELRTKLHQKKLPQDVLKEGLKQVSRLERMHPDSSESSILRSYIDWVIDLPWTEEKKEITELQFAKDILDHDHYELPKIKERILEYLAVRALKGGPVKGPILCFSGPPGVGKTSLGKSIAKATGREFVRISLGGVKDESEIRGHRRTYVGAMPGRFIQAMKQVKSINPIIMLDEIDKLGSDFRGDPSAALLEVLDPEQNHNFRDNYLNVPYDLSKVMFIATANVLESIPGPLRDRMEIINLSGYTHEEKIEISKKYLIPKQMDENGITHEHIEFTEEGVHTVIHGFTREAGLRNLERQIGSLCRKVAKKIATGDCAKTHIFSHTVEELLGPAPYGREEQNEQDEIGIATGLAWTAAGGEILKVEATSMRGRGITLTGQLGDVMKESAHAAMGYVRSHAQELGIDENTFEKTEVHVHLPAGAIPKDGPSAGITLATVIISLLTKTPISKDIAMTGEITLTGKVLPVGGIKEKALAAMRAGLETIIIPWKNQKDLSDIPATYRKKLNFIPVRTIQEVLAIALVDWEAQRLRLTEEVMRHLKDEESSKKNSSDKPKGKKVDKDDQFAA
jgi:ATP-dependent Lon protease